MINKNKAGKVIVAMSGGVDSSAAAALLKKEGYDVIGVFMKFWSDPKSKLKFENKCCSLESIQSARRTANQLGIPFYVINVEKEFKKEVVNYFIREYEKGRTPNPCVECNREIKFKILFRKLLELKADYIATGHYAKIVQSYGLFEAEDKNKDQSYFLYILSQKQLSKILFPLGKLMKSEVRQLAKKFKLSVHDKKESQDICFVHDKRINDFLKRHIRMKSGNIIDQNGKILGHHEGLPLYTIGQRKGINLGGTGPFYVIEKNNKRNELIVTNNSKDKKLYSPEIIVKKANWIINKPRFPFKAYVKNRYQTPSLYAKIESKGKLLKVILNKPQRAVTPGQSAVFYNQKGEVLGGGIIS